MPSKINICNLALHRLKVNPIQSIDDKTNEAQAVSAVYDIVLDAALREYEWNFAQRSVVLAQLTEEYPGYAFAYAVPSDCLCVRKVYVPELDKTVTYEVQASSSLSSKVILADDEGCAMCYTARVTNPNQFDAIFVDAFAWRLAADLAVPLRSKGDLHQAYMQLYWHTVSKAAAVDASESNVSPPEFNSFVEARQ